MGEFMSNTNVDSRDSSVPPRWIIEPVDKAVALGSDANLECKADGFPKPSLSWKKAAGKLFDMHNDEGNSFEYFYFFLVVLSLKKTVAYNLYYS